MSILSFLSFPEIENLDPIHEVARILLSNWYLNYYQTGIKFTHFSFGVPWPRLNAVRVWACALWSV